MISTNIFLLLFVAIFRLASPELWVTHADYAHQLLCIFVQLSDSKTKEKKFQGQRAFSHLGPVTWNKLPYSVRHAQTQSQFKTRLKTTLFRSVYEQDS